MARRIIQTGITKEILSGDNQPQIQIGDKLYVVDDRQKTFNLLQKINEDEKLTEYEQAQKTFELTLGKEAAKEIDEMNIPVQNYIYLTYCVMAAITGEEPDELMKRARQGKN